MNVLHIQRSAPDEMTRALIEKTHAESGTTIVSLFEGDIDYAQLVKNIFKADKVISWW